MKFDSYADARNAIWPDIATDTPERYASAKLSDRLPHTRKGQSVLLIGPAGTGKTHTMWGLVNAVRKAHNSRTDYKRRGALMWSEADVERWKFCAHTVDAVSCYPHVLLIDDIGYLCHGDQMPDRWLQHFIYSVLDYRDSHCMTTVLSTNLTRDRVAQTYGPHVASRMWGGAVIHTGGNDRRAERGEP